MSVILLEKSMESRKEKAKNAALELCAVNDAKLVYLTVFGSELYGTSTGKSDLDVRGIFVPSLRSIILGTAKKSLHFSTGKDADKNSPADMDIDLWSVENWVMHLLPNGDTGALDLLFSPSNKECVLYDSGLLSPVFRNPLKFLDLANNNAYAQYSLSQAKKYGIKGSRLGAIRAVWKLLQEWETEGRLSEYIDKIALACGHEQYCFVKDMPDGQKSLILCGKTHVGGIKMAEFRERVCRDMEMYGERAKAAEANQGVDYKALSHAFRALNQMEELLLTGKIEFPLASRDMLMSVKRGDIPWNELESIILTRLDEVKRLHETMAQQRQNLDPAFAENFLLNCYGLGHQQTQGEVEDAVRKELARIEQEYGVRVLFAAEAGSRAWGFPSLDSDYDVRFVYAHDPDWYLDVAPERKKDCIERSFELPGIGEMDMAGWDIRKALKLFQAGNPQIAEWLNSSILYKEEGDFASLLRDLLADSLSMGNLWHHYAGMVRSARKSLSSGNQSSKGLLYVIRPLLILLWLEKGLGVPPVEMEIVLDGVLGKSPVATQICKLVDMKRNSLEQENRPTGKKLMSWLEFECNRLDNVPPALDYSRNKPDVDAIFRHCIGV